MFFDVLLQYLPMLLQGLWLTLQLVGIASAAGFLLAIPMALIRHRRIMVLRQLVAAYVFFFRGTPLLVQLFLVYYGLSQFDGVKNSWLWSGFLESPFWCAMLAIALNATAYMCEILFGALRAVPYDQVEAARAFGMSQRVVYQRILLPQALRIGLSNYSNELIILIKGSALASTITLMELTGVTRTIIARTYMPIELYALAGSLYLILNVSIARVFRWLEKRLMPYRIVEKRAETQPKQPAVLYGIA